MRDVTSLVTGVGEEDTARFETLGMSLDTMKELHSPTTASLDSILVSPTAGIGTHLLYHAAGGVKTNVGGLAIYSPCQIWSTCHGLGLSGEYVQAPFCSGWQCC